MSDLSGFPYAPLEFNKDGSIHDVNQVAAAKTMVGDKALTDLIVVSHGWNNNTEEAMAFYTVLAQSMRRVLDNRDPSFADGRTLGMLGFFWPSKKFTAKELQPADGAASFDAGVDDGELVQQLNELKGSFDAQDADARLEEASNLVADLEHNRDAQDRFVDALRGLVGEPPDLAGEHPPDVAARVSEALRDMPGSELLELLEAPSEQEMALFAQMGHDLGGAAGLGDFFQGIKAGGMRLLNYLTYWQMKKRAGVVGANGANQVLVDLRSVFPDMRIHLVGHSFGARLVTAATKGGDRFVASSMSLLQAAFSHNGFAHQFDGQHDGFFRIVVTDQRITGPCIITHTKNDTAVGIAYPIASRLSRDQAAALGDANDPYGGLGRNGAQHTPEALDARLLDETGNYTLEAQKLHNLLADDFIANHGDVENPAVANAILHAVVKG